MKTELLDITDGNNVTIPGLDKQLSLAPLISYLKTRIESSSPVKGEIFTQILNRLQSNKYLNDIINPTDIIHFENELEWIYSILQPPLENEEQNLWALGFVIEPTVFYGTDGFYDFVHSRATLFDNCTNSIDRKRQLFNKKMLLYYTLILEKVYHYSISTKKDYSQTVFIENDGLPRYYRFYIDTRFVEVIAKAELPKIELSEVVSEIQKANFGLENGLSILPLELFAFRGFSITTVEDVTSEQSVENIKNLALHQRVNDLNDNKEIVRSLKSLMGSADIEFGLLPNLKVTGRLILPGEADAMVDAEGSTMDIRPDFSVLLEEMLNDPKTLIFEDSVSDDKYAFIGQYMKKANIRSYALLPIFHSNKIVGLLEIYSMQKERLFKDRLGELRAVLPTLAQLLKNTIDEFNHKIDDIIKNHFTALQPAVRWKFEEIACRYLNNEKNKSKIIEDIRFENVYPLYGAIDVKDSTTLRNKALVLDLSFQLNSLTVLLENAKSKTGLILLDEILFRAKQWLVKINDDSNDNDILLLNEFLDGEVLPLLQGILPENASLKADLDRYLKAVDPIYGEAFEYRRAFENSMAAINAVTNQHLEELNKELQEIYPAYFEKFRTDGVEYELYIGQSITPGKKFNQLYLRNIRLRQLTSMAEIARATEIIDFQNNCKLRTTQLIFIRSVPIDIAFRVDERKFDVEGSYNIRYHIVKKRIDKVHIKNTRERLTQPGKIAIVYFNKSEEYEYKEYIKYLQQQGFLKSDLEQLELEDLQGVSGLRALRVSIEL